MNLERLGFWALAFWSEPKLVVIMSYVFLWLLKRNVSAIRTWMYVGSEKKQLKIKMRASSFSIDRHNHLVCAIFLVCHPVLSVQWRLNLVFRDVICIVLRRSLRGYCADSRTLRKFDLKIRTRENAYYQQSTVAFTVTIIIIRDLITTAATRKQHLAKGEFVFYFRISWLSGQCAILSKTLLKLNMQC